MDADVPVRPGNVEVVDLGGQDIHVLLHSFLNGLISIVPDLYFKAVAALSGGEEDTIHVLVFGGDVEEVDTGGELCLSLGDGDHERVDGVGAREAFAVEDAAEGEAQGVGGRSELAGHGQDYFGAVDDGGAVDWVEVYQKGAEVARCYCTF